jgi:hypothetical protein
MGVACVGCGKSTGSSSSSSSSAEDETFSPEELESMQKQDMTFEYALDAEEEDSSVDVPVNQGVVTQSTDEGTSYVVVTDESGQQVLDSDGNVVTELVSDGNSSTTTTKAAGNSASNNGNSASDNTSSDYTASMKTFQAYWLDMSSGADVVCNGDFLDVTFKIKDDAPDGNYALIEGSNDFANWDAESVSVDYVEGDIAVGSASEKTAGTATDGTFTIVGGTAKGNQGDEVTVRFDMSDNPGIVALIFRFQYDSNALEVVNAVVGDDCSDAINMAVN